MEPVSKTTRFMFELALFQFDLYMQDELAESGRSIQVLFCLTKLVQGDKKAGNSNTGNSHQHYQYIINFFQHFGNFT